MSGSVALASARARLPASQRGEFRRAGTSSIVMTLSGPPAVAFFIRGPIGRADLPGLCARICALLEESSAGVLVCDVDGIDADAVTVDALARPAARRPTARPPGSPAQRLGGPDRASSPSWASRTSCSRRRRSAVGALLPGATPARAGRADRTAGTACRCRGRSVELDDPAVLDLERPGAPTARSPRRGALGLYCPNAGAPFAATVGISREPAAAGAGAEAPGDDVVGTAQPQRVRRHRQRRVLVQQRDERRRCRSARRRRRSAPAAPAAPRPAASRRSALAEVGCAASVARARCSALLTDATVVLEQLGHLVGLPVQHLAQDQHGALLRRAGAAARRRTRAGSSRAPRPRSAGSPSLGTTRPSGTGSIQVRLGQRGAERALSADRERPEVHRPRAALAAAEHVEADVGRDAVQPRPQRRAALEARRSRATRAPASPGPRPRPRTPSRACGSSSR